MIRKGEWWSTRKRGSGWWEVRTEEARTERVGGSQVDGQQEKKGQLNRLPALVGGDKSTSQLMSVTTTCLPWSQGESPSPT